MNKPMHAFLFLSPLSLLMCACSSDNTDLKKYMDAVAHQLTAPADVLPHLDGLTQCQLPTLNLESNPFQWSPLSGFKKSQQHPLTGFPLNALKFVGTLKKGGVMWALIKQPDDVVIRVGVGESMGTQEGRILFIQDDRIQLEETITHFNQKSKQMTTLVLDVSQ